MYKIVFTMVNGEQHSMSDWDGEPFTSELTANAMLQNLLRNKKWDSFRADDGTIFKVQHIVSAKVANK
ncbi:MAG: hypothetical protein Q8N09_03730 [Thermodesulfovibrionia bacterium]|nr:hypothetical protein [Thermodesulfovibrionia bacterium]